MADERTSPAALRGDRLLARSAELQEKLNGLSATLAAVRRQSLAACELARKVRAACPRGLPEEEVPR